MSAIIKQNYTNRDLYGDSNCTFFRLNPDEIVFQAGETYPLISVGEGVCVVSSPGGSDFCLALSGVEIVNIFTHSK